MHYSLLSRMMMATDKAHSAGQKQVAAVERWPFVEFYLQFLYNLPMHLYSWQIFLFGDLQDPWPQNFCNCTACTC